MNKEFYAGNRKSLYQKLEAGSLVVVFSGHAPIKTKQKNFPELRITNMWQHSGMIFPDNYFLAMLRKFILILTRFMKIRRQ